jgi:hypothetical protein
MTMSAKGAGTLEADSKVPNQEEIGFKANFDYGVKQAARKPLDPSIFSRYDREGITAQLQAYLDLGLTPIPLRGKIPLVKWRKGWNRRSIADLKSFIQRGTNWGLKTGANFAVIDFDHQESFTKFIVTNIDSLGPAGGTISGSSPWSLIKNTV